MRFVILALVLAALGAGSLWLGERGARTIERLLLERAEHGFGVLGIEWAELKADGLRLDLHGQAPDSSAHWLALETVRAAVPLATVVDRATIARTPPAARVPIMVELMRDGGKVLMTGRFHGERMRARLIGELREALPKLQLDDLTGINAAPPEPGWGPELAVAALATARIEDAYVRVEPGAVKVEGVVPDAAARERLSGELLARAGETVRLSLDLHPLPQVAVPYLFAASKDGSGALRAETCHARDPEEAARLEAALGGPGAAPGAQRCSVALGGPAGDWAGAVEAGLRGLEGLPAGAVRIEDRSVLLEAADDVPTALMEGVRATLSEALPEGFALIPSEGQEAAATDEAGDIAYRLRFRRTATSAVIGGVVPGETARRLIGTYAEARLGPVRLETELAPEGAIVPDGWEPAALAALDALGRLPKGKAEIAPGRIRLAGEVAEPGVAGQVDRQLRANAPPGYAVETALTVDLPAAVSAVPPTVARCAVLLNRAVAREPISFAPGDVVFEGDSDAVLDRLAEILGRCERGRVEVGGHTDSRGAAELNQRLSRGRAEAVVDALIARGVPLSMLTARGYGEDEPVATNATEEGRAQNRRISFKALDCGSGRAPC